MSNNEKIKRESINDVLTRIRDRKKIDRTNLVDESTEQLLPTRKKVSKNSKKISTSNRKAAANEVIKNLLLGELTQGQALKILRVNILGLKQDIFANLVNVSRKTLSDIENDKGSYNTDILNKVFKPFGLKVGILPSSPQLLSALLIDGSVAKF